MENDPPGGDREALARAQEAIERQQEEIQHLRRRLARSGMSFSSCPAYYRVTASKALLRRFLMKAPEYLELMAVYRPVYLPRGQPRPTIDWSRQHRKRLSRYVFRDTRARHPWRMPRTRYSPKKYEQMTE